MTVWKVEHITRDSSGDEGSKFVLYEKFNDAVSLYTACRDAIYANKELSIGSDLPSKGVITPKTNECTAMVGYSDDSDLHFLKLYAANIDIKREYSPLDKEKVL